MVYLLNSQPLSLLPNHQSLHASSHLRQTQPQLYMTSESNYVYLSHCSCLFHDFHPKAALASVNWILDLEMKREGWYSENQREQYLSSHLPQDPAH